MQLFWGGGGIALMKPVLKSDIPDSDTPNSSSIIQVIYFTILDGRQEYIKIPPVPGNECDDDRRGRAGDRTTKLTDRPIKQSIDPRESRGES